MTRQEAKDYIITAASKERAKAVDQAPLENSEQHLDAITTAFIKGAAQAMSLVMRGRATPTELVAIEQAVIGAGTALGVYPSVTAKIIKRGEVTDLCIQPQGYDHPIRLPVITSGSRESKAAWTWNGDIDAPTLRPSIRTTQGDGRVSHFWLTNGICQFLDDSTDGNAGQSIPLQPINPALL